MPVDITKALVDGDALALLRALVEGTNMQDAMDAAKAFVASTKDHKSVTLPETSWAAITDLIYSGAQADEYALSPGVIERTTEEDENSMAAVDALNIQLYGKPFC